MACCEICGSTFSLKNNLSVHIKIVHNQENGELINCKRCDYKGKKVNLVQHLYDTHREQKLNCDMCEQSFSDKSALNRHIKTKHVLSESHFCPICYKTFSRKDNMKSHTSVHNKTKPKKQIQNTTCEFCQKKFANSKSLKKHRKNIHLIIVSDTRNMSHSSQPQIEQPVSQVEFEVLECQPCQKFFSTKSNLNKHMKLPHHGLKRKWDEEAQCIDCSKVFYNQSTLNRHMKAGHCSTKQKEHQKCEDCDYSFSNNHACEECGVAFKNSQLVKTEEVDTAWVDVKAEWIKEEPNDGDVTNKPDSCTENVYATEEFIKQDIDNKVDTIDPYAEDLKPCFDYPTLLCTAELHKNDEETQNNEEDKSKALKALAALETDTVNDPNLLSSRCRGCNEVMERLLRHLNSKKGELCRRLYSFEEIKKHKQVVERKKHKKWRCNNKEKVQESEKVYRIKNREKIQKSRKDYKIKIKERLKESKACNKV